MSYDEVVAIATRNYEAALFYQQQVSSYQQQVSSLALLAIGLLVLAVVLVGCLACQITTRRRLEAEAARQETLAWTISEIDRIGANGRSTTQRIAEDTIAQLDRASRRMAS